MGSIEIKGFALSQVEVLKIKNALDKLLCDDLHIVFDFLEGGIKMLTDEELKLKPNYVRVNNGNHIQ